MPREKYSPFLLVLRVYFWPLSRLAKTTTPSTIGLPSTSLQPPFTVAEPTCETTGAAHIPSIKRTRANTARCFFIFASRQKISMDFRLFLKNAYSNLKLRSTAQPTETAKIARLSPSRRRELDLDR